MSDFLAEARIIVRPDTSRFRAELEAQLRAVTTTPITVPVAAVAAGGVNGLTTATAGLTAANTSAVVSTEALTAAQNAEAAAAAKATASQVAHNRAMEQGLRGAAASGLTLFGLRGATLAASGAFLAGTAAVVAFAKGVKLAAALETELNVFRVTAGATADEMERVSEAAQQLGRDVTLPGVAAGDAAKAMTELAKAGLSVQDSLAGARGVLQLATAAQIDVAASTELVAGALNSFDLAGTDAVRVADLLTGAAKESQGEITDMATALQQAAAVSKLFGVEIEDSVTLLTQLAQAGIAGGRAGTSLRVAFLRLVNPPAAAAKALKELNIQLEDAEGNLRPQVFTDIIEALNGYEKSQRRATLATIFGSDAIRAAGIIGNKGAAAFEATRASITEQGLASEAAAARTSGLAGDAENLANQVEALGLTMGRVASGPVGALTRGLAGIVGAVNDANAAIEETGVLQEFGDRIGGFLTSFQRLDQLFKQGVRGADSTSDSFSTLNAISVSLTKTFEDLADVFAGVAADLQQQGPQDLGFGVKQLENIVTGFDAQEVRARIAADNAALLDVLNREKAFLERQLRRAFVQNRPKLQRALEQALLGTVNDIRTIQKQAASEAESVKREAEQAATAREQALLAGFGLARDQQQNRIAGAELTQGLQDDIRQQKALRALVLEQIKAVRQRISVEGGRKEAVVALQAILLQVDGALASLAKQQQAAQAEQRKALLEAASLDVEFAEITENQAAEVAARNKKLALLNKQLQDEARLHGKNTVAYKTIRNQIAAERAAIDAITAEKRKENQSFAQASFEFLQAQQGFASSLLGNLIPRGATGGLVGQQQPVQQALQPVAGAAEARSASGPTMGQGNATNHLLQQILAQLKELNGETKAPEARRQHAWSLSVMDGVGGT